MQRYLNVAHLLGSWNINSRTPPAVHHRVVTVLVRTWKNPYILCKHLFLYTASNLNFVFFMKPLKRQSQQQRMTFSNFKNIFRKNKGLIIRMNPGDSHKCQTLFSLKRKSVRWIPFATVLLDILWTSRLTDADVKSFRNVRRRTITKFQQTHHTYILSNTGTGFVGTREGPVWWYECAIKVSALGHLLTECFFSGR